MGTESITIFWAERGEIKNAQQGRSMPGINVGVIEASIDTGKQTRLAAMFRFASSLWKLQRMFSIPSDVQVYYCADVEQQQDSPALIRLSAKLK